MEAKEAVLAAKRYLAHILSDENPTDIGLEEIERDGGDWLVTLGFFRGWNDKIGIINSGKGLEDFFRPSSTATTRTYRTIRIRDLNGEVISMKKHEGVHF